MGWGAEASGCSVKSLRGVGGGPRASSPLSFPQLHHWSRLTPVAELLTHCWPLSFQKPVRTALAPSRPASGPCPLQKCKRGVPFKSLLRPGVGGSREEGAVGTVGPAFSLSEGGCLTGHDAPLGPSQSPR